MNTELQKLHDFIKQAGVFGWLGEQLARRKANKLLAARPRYSWGASTNFIDAPERSEINRWITGADASKAQRMAAKKPQQLPAPVPAAAPATAAAPKPSMWEQYQGAFNKNPLAVGGLTAGGFMLANNALKGGNGAGGNRTVIL
ncbi:MAG: hypothetical protein WC517_03405 [Patescibacteria group bacterium]